MGAIRNGRELRHVPIALDCHAPAVVTALAVRSNGVVTPVRHVPVALHPLAFALYAGSDPVDDATELVLIDASTGGGSGSVRPDHAQHLLPEHAARLAVRRTGDIDIAGMRIVLYEPLAATNGFQTVPRRWWTYALAGRAAARSRRTAQGLGMSALELRALDCYYVSPRPVYVVAVQHLDRSNLFPMDLVGPLTDDRFTLALRTTSPSVVTMRVSRRVVLSIAPASWKDTVYTLGAHHKRASIDASELPFRLGKSRTFALAVPEGVPGYREIEILAEEAIGSHTFFVGRIVYLEEWSDPTAQLAHVSGLFAAWRNATGRPLEPA